MNDRVSRVPGFEKKPERSDREPRREETRCSLGRSSVHNSSHKTKQTNYENKTTNLIMKISQTATLLSVLCAAPHFGLATTDVDLADNVGLASLRGTVSNSVDPNSDRAHRKLEKMGTYTCDCELGSWGDDGCKCEEVKNFRTDWGMTTSITATVTCKNKHQKVTYVGVDGNGNDVNVHSCNSDHHMDDNGCNDKFDWRVHKKAGFNGNNFYVNYVICEVKSEDELKNSGYTKNENGGSPEPGSLLRCEADCDNDSECGDGLKCFKRPDGDTSDVPGCVGTVKKGWDYCIEGDEPVIISAGYTKKENGGSPELGSLHLCQGDCDNDSECGAGLRCLQRPNGDTSDVPGCLGTPKKGWDYCVREEDMP